MITTTTSAVAIPDRNVMSYCSSSPMNAKTSRQPFGRYLKQRRVELDLTQQDVAKQGGLSQTYLSDLENSSDEFKVPTRRMIPKIAKGLGVTLAEVEAAAGLQPGTISEAKAEYVAGSPFIPPPGMKPITLSTGDLIFLRPDDPDPDATIRAMEAWMSGYRAGQSRQH